MEIDRKGCTRIVLIFKNFVVKLPSMYCFESFLEGILSNIREYKFKDSPADFNLAPILFRLTPLILVMKKCEPVVDIDKYFNDLDKLCKDGGLPTNFYLSDAKPENYGYMKGKLLKIDYGD